MEAPTSHLEGDGEILPLARFLSGECVTIYVGQGISSPNPLDAARSPRRATEGDSEVEIEVAEYTLHKDLLCDSSDLFSLAFRGEMREALTGKMHLPDETEENFEVFAEWLYNRRLPAGISVEKLLDIYFLADKFLAATLREQCLIRFIERYSAHSIPNDRTLKPLLSRPSTCPLRAYYVELYSYLILTRKEQHRWTQTLELDESFAADVAKEMALMQKLTDSEDEIEHPLTARRIRYALADQLESGSS